MESSRKQSETISPGYSEENQDASYWKEKYEEARREISQLQGVIEELRHENDLLQSTVSEPPSTRTETSENDSVDSDDTVDLEKMVTHKDKQRGDRPVPLSLLSHSRSVSNGGESSPVAGLHDGRPRQDSNLKQFAARLVEGLVVSGVPSVVTCSQVAALHANAYIPAESENTCGSWRPPHILPQTDPTLLKVVGESLQDDAASLVNWFLPRGSCEQTKQFEWPKRSRMGVPLEECVALLTKRLWAKLASPQLHYFTTSCSDSSGEDAGLPSSTRYCVCLVFPQPVGLDPDRVSVAFMKNNEMAVTDSAERGLDTLLSMVNTKYFAVSQRCFTIVSRYPFFELIEELLFAIYKVCIRPEIEKELEHITRMSMNSIKERKTQNGQCWWLRGFSGNGSGDRRERRTFSACGTNHSLTQDGLSEVEECKEFLDWLVAEWNYGCPLVDHSTNYEALYSWFHSKLSDISVPNAGEKVVIPVDIFKNAYAKIDTIEWMRPEGTENPGEILRTISSSDQLIIRQGCLRFQTSQTSTQTVGLPLPTEEASMLIQFHALSRVLHVVPLEKLLALVSALLVEDYVIIAGRDLSYSSKASPLKTNLKHFRSIKHFSPGESNEDHGVPPEWKRERYMVSLICLLLQSLVSPLRWIGPVIPVIPSDYEELLSSPVSILAGLECIGPDAAASLPSKSIVFSLPDASISYGSDECQVHADVPGRQRLMESLNDISKRLKQTLGKEDELQKHHQDTYKFAMTLKEHIFGLLVDFCSLVGNEVSADNERKETALDNSLENNGRQDERPFWLNFINTQMIEGFCSTFQEEAQKAQNGEHS